MPSDQFHRVEKLTGDCEKVRLIGEKDNPSFTHSWVNFGGVQQPAGFYKDQFNRVWLQGLIKDGTVDNSYPYSPAFTLPVEYRPQYEIIFDQVDGTRSPSAVITITEATDVNHPGAVSINKGDNGHISLDGISWRV